MILVGTHTTASISGGMKAGGISQSHQEHFDASSNDYGAVSHMYLQPLFAL